MDVFVEQIVKKPKTLVDTLKVVLSVVAIILVILFIPTVASVQYLGTIALLVCAGLIYLLYNIMLSSKIEYEYIFTNGAMDVDKIIAARRRKKLTELNAREIDFMAKVSNRAHKNYADSRDVKKIYACADINDKDTYFVVYLFKGNKTMLYFNPEERIVDGFRRLNPQKVVLD